MPGDITTPRAGHHECAAGGTNDRVLPDIRMQHARDRRPAAGGSSTGRRHAAVPRGFSMNTRGKPSCSARRVST